MIALNRQAQHEYFVEDRYEAGIVLNGGEVKSLRAGNVTFTDSFCIISGDNEVFLKNAYIKGYEMADGFTKTDAKRDRKLLLNKSEIRRLRQKTAEKGYTLVPLRFYFKGALIKLEIGVCKGKHTYDKKKTLVENVIKRHLEREIKGDNL